MDSFFNVAYTSPNGAPAAACGSVTNPNTCAASNCHGGTATVQPGWITSTIPVSGYVPGTTYTITATATYAGRSTFGFEISPQNTAGMLKGTMIVTNATATKTISTNRYVTHKQAGISGTSGSHTWSFNWTAPAMGGGTVIFYGAFLCADGNGNENGDITYKSNLTVNEDITTGVTDEFSLENGISVYPNPVVDHLNVNYRVTKQGKTDIKLYDSQGRMIAPLLSETKAPGDYQDSFDFPFNENSGIYFLEISTETSNSVKKILVQR